MTVQERLDTEVAQRDTLAKQAEALKQAADSKSASAIQKLQQAEQEAAAAATSAKQELANEQAMVGDSCLGLASNNTLHQPWNNKQDMQWIFGPPCLTLK